MKIISTIADLRAAPRPREARRVLVPTMGALHAGHRLAHSPGARRVQAPKGEVAVSIFVNPLQFEPGADFSRYPRPESADEELCRAEGVDLIFRPAPNEMYFEDRSTFVEETTLSERLCGASRPGHFRGVCTVVTKLFHLLSRRTRRSSGKRIFSSWRSIRRMVRDLDFPVEIIAGPTVREADGLALSSRNQYLSAEERAQAPIIRHGAARRRRNRRRPARARWLAIGAARRSNRRRSPGSTTSRSSSADDLQPRLTIEPRSLLAVAVFFGQTRLIDNILLG